MSSASVAACGHWVSGLTTAASTLLVVHEFNGAWTFHGLGAPGIKLSEADTVAVCEGILKRVRGVVR